MIKFLTLINEKVIIDTKHELTHMMMYTWDSLGVSHPYKTKLMVPLPDHKKSAKKWIELNSTNAYKYSMSTQELYTFSKDLGEHAKNLNRLLIGDEKLYKSESIRILNRANRMIYFLDESICETAITWGRNIIEKTKDPLLKKLNFTDLENQNEIQINSNMALISHSNDNYEGSVISIHYLTTPVEQKLLQDFMQEKFSAAKVLDIIKEYQEKTITLTKAQRSHARQIQKQIDSWVKQVKSSQKETLSQKEIAKLKQIKGSLIALSNRVLIEHKSHKKLFSK